MNNWLIGLHNNENILLCKIPCEEDEMKSYRQEENICNHRPDKRLIYRIYEEVSKVNIENQTIQLRDGQRHEQPFHLRGYTDEKKHRKDV